MKYLKIFKKFQTFLNEQEKENCPGVENVACRCVDNSQTNLSIEQVQEFLKKIYGTEEGTGLSISFSGKFGHSGQGKPDGVCGKETRSFIMKFQTGAGICADACVGTETEAAMRKKDPSFFTNLPSGTTSSTSGPSTSTSTSSTQSTSQDSRRDSDTGNEPLSTTPSIIASSGVTISIKAAKPTPGGYISAGLGPNYHGYQGKFVTPKISKDDAGMINSVNFQGPMNSAKGIIAQSHRKNRQWGNPILLSLLIAAAAHVVNYVTNKKETFKKSDSIELWNVSKKHGGPLYKHAGHQSGLECDIGFYKKNGTPDVERNAVFLEFLLSQDVVESVLLDFRSGPVSVAKMRAWIIKNNLEEKFPKVMNSSNSSKPQLAPASPGSHDDHYHIRCHFPDGSPSMSDYTRDEKVAQKSNNMPGAPISARGGPRKVKINVQKTKRYGFTRRYHSLRNKTIDEIVKQYGLSFSFTFGVIDGDNGMPQILEHHNQEAKFIGASMPKTMAALAHLITYSPKNPENKNNINYNPDSQINDCEVKAILTYWSRQSEERNIPQGEKCKKFHDSNYTLSAISGTDRRREKRRRKFGFRNELGVLSKKQIRKVSEKFGITKSTFTFGANYQTSKDMFLFFAGLARMDQEKLSKIDPLYTLYYGDASNGEPSYKEEIKNLINIQKMRTYSRKMSSSGAMSIKGYKSWGKGGLSNGSVNFAWVVRGRDGRTYVLSVYSLIKREPSLLKSASQQEKRDRAARIYSNNSHGYDLINAVLYKLMEKT